MDRKDMSPKQGVIVSLIGLLVVVVYGFAVFIPLEPTWSFADTFYFILVTLSTNGYGDIVPNTGLTQLTTVPLLFGVYFFFLTVMSLATAFVNTVHQYIKSRKPTSYVNDEFETNTPMEQLELAVLPNISAAPQKITVVVEEETPPVAATAAVDPHNNNSSLADIQIR
jgi:voltage-gated potassium channel